MAGLTQHSIAATMTASLGSHPAWRSFFLLLIITTSVAFFLTAASLIIGWKALATKPPGQHHLDPQKNRLFQVLLRLDFFGLVAGSIAMISLHFALYLGATQHWNSSSVITLFTAGFGVPSGLFVFLQSKKHSAEEMLPVMIPIRELSFRQSIQAFYISLWGVSFYSFSYFTCKSYRRLWGNSN
jgi:hypothetical protein